MQKQNVGISRSVYIPNGIDEQIEKTRKKLGWSRSYFYRYAVTKLLQELTVLKTAAHEEEGASK